MIETKTFFPPQPAKLKGIAQDGIKRTLIVDLCGITVKNGQIDSASFYHTSISGSSQLWALTSNLEVARHSDGKRHILCTQASLELL